MGLGSCFSSAAEQWIAEEREMTWIAFGVADIFTVFCLSSTICSLVTCWIWIT
jgi:hypothetical protein